MATRTKKTRVKTERDMMVEDYELQIFKKMKQWTIGYPYEFSAIAEHRTHRVNLIGSTQEYVIGFYCDEGDVRAWVIADDGILIPLRDRMTELDIIDTVFDPRNTELIDAVNSLIRKINQFEIEEKLKYNVILK